MITRRAASSSAAIVAALALAPAARGAIPAITDAEHPEAFSLRIGGYTQFRYTLNVRDTAGGQTQLTNGFDVRRAYLNLRGTVLSQHLEYFINTSFSNSVDSTLDTQDIWLRYTPDGGPWSATLGQLKPPVLREELVSSTRQLAMDRSLANEIYNQDYAEGVLLAYDDGQSRAQLALTDGLRTASTPFTSPREADVALSARLEHAWGDRLKRFADFTSWRSAESAAVMLGVAGHWETAGRTASFPSDAPRRDQYLLTADASVEGPGWSAFAAIIARVTDPESGQTLTDLGAVVQGSVFVAEQTELFARWDAVFPDEEAPSGGTDEFNTFTLGANHYFVPESHAAKLVVEAVYFPDAQADSSALVRLNSNAGLVTDDRGNQLALRAMMQLVF